MKLFARQAMVAALYAAASIAIAPLSFGMVQVRFAEILMLLVFIDARYSAALIIGCFMTNLFSPLGAIDAVVGTLATALCCLALAKMENVYYSLVALPLINGLIIGAELTFLWDLPFLLSAFSVAAGELGAMLIGVILYKKFAAQLRRII